MEPDQEKRKKIVWEIERRAGRGRGAADALPQPLAAPAGSPYVKGYTPMVNSIYNGWRMEDVWLDR